MAEPVFAVTILKWAGGTIATAILGHETVKRWDRKEKKALEEREKRLEKREALARETEAFRDKANRMIEENHRLKDENLSLRRKLQKLSK